MTRKQLRLKNPKLVIVLAVFFLFVVSVSCIIFVIHTNQEPADLPFNEVKNPQKITWEQYQQLSPEEQAYFPDNFENMDEYNAWYEKNNPNDQKSDIDQTEVKIPIIDLQGKSPLEWTWEEYQELSPEEQAYFPDYFESFEEYQLWYDKVSAEELKE